MCVSVCDCRSPRLNDDFICYILDRSPVWGRASHSKALLDVHCFAQLLQDAGNIVFLAIFSCNTSMRCKGVKTVKILKFTDELAEKLYKPVTRKWQWRKINVNGIDEIWAADLIDMKAFSKDAIKWNKNGIKYVLIVIDVFSKFVCIIPLKRKFGQEVANAFSRILKERRPSKLMVGKGREFNSKDVKNQMSSSLQKTKKNCKWLKDWTNYYELNVWVFLCK